MGILYLFLPYNIYYGFGKNANSTGNIVWLMPYIILRFVWRQSEFAFFGAVTSVAALFVLERRTDFYLHSNRKTIKKGKREMEENKIITETNEATDKKFCTSCGAELHPEAVMCPACGAAQEVSAEAEKKELKGFKKFINRFKTDKKLWIICGGVLATIVIAVVVSVLVYRSSLRYYWNKTNDTYPKANCGLGSDFIELDTNTYDIDTDDMTLTQYRMYVYNLEDTLNAIKFLNNEFGFSSSVYDDMMETSSLMGTQSISNSKYRISWTYHPDEGLEVRYEKN